MTAKKAYLTIDDSPSQHMIERIRFLADRNIPAVWFCRGDYLEANSESGISALRAGHILGNHGYDHTHFSKLTLDQGLDQIDRTERIITAVHDAAKIERKMKCFRFPYEEQIGTPEHFAALQKGLHERGFLPLRVDGVTNAAFLSPGATENLSWFWTYDSEDWKLSEPEVPGAFEKMDGVLARMSRNEPDANCGLNSPGTEIIVLHDHDRTGAQWQNVVSGLIAKGLDFRLPV